MKDGNSAIQDYNTRDQDFPRKFKVTITETLKRTIDAGADDQHDAEQIVSNGWYSSKYILGAEDLVDVKFEAAPTVVTLE